MQVADRELVRREEIENTLDYISRQLGQLQITETLPTVNVPSHALFNSAMEVRSAVMRYLTVQIRHQSTALGLTGFYYYSMSLMEQEGLLRRWPPATKIMSLSIKRWKRLSPVSIYHCHITGMG